MPEITEMLQPYNESRDLKAAYDLWQVTLAETWPIEFSRFQQVLAGPEAQHFVAREGDQLIGFVATLKGRRGKNSMGHLAALLVTAHSAKAGYWFSITRSGP